MNGAEQSAAAWPSAQRTARQKRAPGCAPQAQQRPATGAAPRSRRRLLHLLVILLAGCDGHPVQHAGRRGRVAAGRPLGCRHAHLHKQEVRALGFAAGQDPVWRRQVAAGPARVAAAAGWHCSRTDQSIDRSCLQRLLCVLTEACSERSVCPRTDQEAKASPSPLGPTKAVLSAPADLPCRPARRCSSFTALMHSDSGVASSCSSAHLRKSAAVRGLNCLLLTLCIVIRLQ